MQKTWAPSLSWEDPLEEEMATHSSILVWKSHGQKPWWATVHGGAKRWTGLSPRLSQLEKACVQQRDPTALKNK